MGVIKNKGKNGSRFAPQAIINHLKKQNNHLNLAEQDAVLVVDITNQAIEVNDFNSSQKRAATIIDKSMKAGNSNKVIHLGGGHDHIYPLLMALDNNEQFENIFIINLDAHCDTRIDPEHHSGTPFRDFDNDGRKPFHIVQYGIHDFANSKSTLASLKRGSESKFFLPEVTKLSNHFTKVPEIIFKNCPFKITAKTAVIISLDCDGIDGSQMQAVSCVNTVGLPLIHIHSIVQQFKNITSGNLIFGIYEFNPVYDNLGLYGCKSITHLIYEYLK